MGIEISSGGVTKTYEYYPDDAFYVDANGNVNTSGQGQQVREAWFNGTKYYPVTHPVNRWPDAVEIIDCKNVVLSYPARCNVDYIPYKFIGDSMTRVFIAEGMTSPVIHHAYDRSTEPQVVAENSNWGETLGYVDLQRYSPGVSDAYDLTYGVFHKDEYAYYAETKTTVPTLSDVGYFPSEDTLGSQYAGLSYYCLNPFSTATLYVLNLVETGLNRNRHEFATVLEIPDYIAFRNEWRSRMSEWPSEYRNQNVARMSYYSRSVNTDMYERGYDITLADDRQIAMNFRNWGGLALTGSLDTINFRPTDLLYIDGVYYLMMCNTYDELTPYAATTNVPSANYHHVGTSGFTASQVVSTLLSSILGRTIDYLQVRVCLQPGTYNFPKPYGHGTFTYPS